MPKGSLGSLAAIAVVTTLIFGTMAGCGSGLTDPTFQSDTTDGGRDDPGISYGDVREEGPRPPGLPGLAFLS